MRNRLHAMKGQQQSRISASLPFLVMTRGRRRHHVSRMASLTLYLNERSPGLHPLAETRGAFSRSRDASRRQFLTVFAFGGFPFSFDEHPDWRPRSDGAKVAL